MLDADADQRAVVEEVLAGRDLIVRGPPGTGKSQTTANLVAALAARGRSVLVVSGARAALDSALGRLERVGLRDLALAVRGAETPDDLARELALALEPAAPPAIEGEDAELERLGAELDDHVEALHGARAPWGISAFDAQAIALGTPAGARTRVRLGADAIAGLTAAALPAAEDAVRRYAELGGLARGAGAGHWARARIEGEGEAARALELVTRLDRETLPAARSAMERAGREVGHAPPEAIGDWRERIELYEAVGSTLETLEPAAFSPGLAAALEPLSLGGLARARATVTDPEFRWARRRLRELSLRPEADETDLYRAVLDARELQRDWQSLVGHANSAPGMLSATPLVAPGNLRELRDRYERLEAELAELDTLLPQLRLTIRSPEELEALFGELRDAGPAPTSLPELRRLQASFRREGLWELIEDCRSADRSPEECALALRFAWAGAVLAHIARDTPSLARFDGAAHRRTAERYRAAVGRRLERNATELRRAHVERVAAARAEWADEAALVEEQGRLPRPSVGLRELAGAAGPLLRALKPCWVMSPSAVGAALPAEPWFDVLVVDEAGRLALGEAAPALLRARQVVMLGDERQLAPAAAPGAPPPASALDALGGIVEERALGTHYRSRDERLAAFANAHVYEGRLATFPGVGGDDPPLRHVLIRPRKEGDAAADEMAAVVRLACEHALSRPHESLGVIAADAAQAARLREALWARAREEPGIAAFFGERGPETPLVTTADGAQGEERDAVILALPAERTDPGGPVRGVGALGAEGGERRICVAVTRARRRLTVVSSFRASDMDAVAAEGPGGRLLQAFLRYAEREGGEPPASAAPVLDPITADVQRALAEAGVPTEARVGMSRRPVELAASHPDRPGRRVLAVELDGPDYRDLGGAPDRDRIRPEQLERMGWTHHRLWSAEWIENRERAISRVREALQRAVRAADAPRPRSRPPAPEAPSRPRPSPRRRAGAPAPAGDGAPPVVVPGREITRYRPEELEEVVRWVRSTARPQDQEELFREVMRVMGFRRRGPRIVQAIERAIEQAEKAEAGR